MDVSSVPEITTDGTCVLEEAECLEETDLATDDDLTNLKALTEKLRLETRRPSYLEWKARLEAARFHEPGSGEGQVFQEEPERKKVKPKETEVCPHPFHSKLSSGVLKEFGNLDEALTWLRRELVSQGLVSFLERDFIYIWTHILVFLKIFFAIHFFLNNESSLDSHQFHIKILVSESYSPSSGL